MRKSVQIIITFIWLTSTIGISMNKHYCHNVLQKISLFSNSGACNDMENMPVDACADETVHFVIDNNFNFEKHTNEPGITVTKLNLIDDYIHITTLTSYYPTPFKENSLPLLDQHRIYTEVQSFLL